MKPKKTFYKVRVRAYIKIGPQIYYGKWSDYFYTAPDLGFDSRKNIKIASVSKKKQPRIKLSWMKVKGATCYEIYMSETNAAGFKKIKTVKKRNIIIKKFNKKKLKKNTKYFFKVVAVKKDGNKTHKAICDAYASYVILKKKK